MKTALLLILATLTISFSAQAQYYPVGNNCYAQTACFTYDGWGRSYYRGTIGCQAASGGGYGYSSNLCSWNVVPNFSVQCTGYVATPYGYQWRNQLYFCPRY